MDKAEAELKIINDLEKIKGLSNFIVLNENDRKFIKQNEESRNIGVLEAIKREHIIAFMHDSSFREPISKIIIEKDGKKIFPAVPFPEVKAKDVVSCSPGHKVDSYLRKKMANVKEDDASLIIGFD